VIPRERTGSKTNRSPRKMTKAARLILLLLLAPLAAHGEEVNQFESFRRAASLGLEPLLVSVFGNDSVLAVIDSLPAGQILRFDTDGDGTIDALAWREGRMRVAALDEDHDLRAGDLRPDDDNDCVLADVDADGILDRVVDAVDLDGDGDADRQDLYEISPGPLGVSGVGITTVMDLDDDNRFLSLTDYTYHANRDQWQSDFDGNVCLVAGERDETSDRWSSSMENPFCFYDDDGDGLSDEALRLEGSDLFIRSMRWSFDADGDATADNPRDYDFSLTATGRIRAPRALADSVVLRDGGVLRFVSWRGARAFARWGLWDSVLLVWDEDDHNTAPFSETPERERWEGVIAEGYVGFPQIGGPNCGRVNKRYELDRDGSGRLGLYWTDVDDRIHLHGAERGEILVHLPAEPAIQRAVRMTDGNGNGFFDTWTYSMELSGIGERTVALRNEAPRVLPLESAAIRSFWRKHLPAARNRSRWDLEQLEQVKGPDTRSAIRHWWLEARDRNDPLTVRAQTSVELERLLYDLALWDAGGGFLARGMEEGKPGDVWRLDCPIRGEFPPREQGVVLDVTDLPGGKNEELLLTSLVEMSTDSVRIAGQPEDWDGDQRPDLLYFPAELPAGGARPGSPSPQTAWKPAITVDPPCPLPRRETTRVDPFFATGIAFESLPIAYRTYDGRLDLFIKRGTGNLFLKLDLGNYHRPQSWGMDALDIGDGPGLGGLYAQGGDGGWRPLFGRDALREQRVIATGPSRAVVRVVLGSGDITLARTWMLAGDERAILETMQADLPAAIDSLIVAVALPALDDRGALPRMRGVWSYGSSAPGAGKIGLAGALFTDMPLETISIDGMPALRFALRDSEPVSLGWVGGGEAYGESSPDTWREQAAVHLRVRGDRDRHCLPE
jgi:hypothetical protein